MDMIMMCMSYFGVIGSAIELLERSHEVQLYPQKSKFKVPS